MSRVFSDQGVKLMWLPTLPANPKLISIAAFTAAKDLSDFAIVGDANFEQAASDTNDRKAYSDKGKVSTPTSRNATGKGAFYRDRTALGVPTADDPLALFDNRQIGYIVKRKGVPEDTAWAAGQDYEFFKLQADAIHTVGDADSDYERFELDYTFKGDVGFGVCAAT